MGLGARNLDDLGRLIALAENPRETSRPELYPELYSAITALYCNQSSLLQPRERQLMQDILRRLTLDVEMAIRIAVAEKIADNPNAPLDLIFFLTGDRLEIARPLILRSRRFTDEELLRFIAGADPARQVLCAQRPRIGELVADALSQSNAEAVLIALALNLTAQMGNAAFLRLVEKSRHVYGLQEPLARRPDLPQALARKMCGWISEALRDHINHRYQAMGDFLDTAKRGETPIESTLLPNSDQNNLKLIEKLATAGQLKPGFLLRVLHQGQFDLFELGLAKLLEIDCARTRRVLYGGGVRSVAMVCRAVGIDRCVFPTFYNLSRHGRRIHQLLSAEDRVDADAVFSSYSRAEALARLQAG